MTVEFELAHERHFTTPPRNSMTFSKRLTCVFISIAALSVCKKSDEGSKFPRRLQGPPDRELIDALYFVFPKHYQHSPENISVTQDGHRIDRTNVSIGFNPGTTVAEVNRILDELDARIISMSKGSAVLFLEIKDPGDLKAYRKTIETLQKRPSVRNVAEGTFNEVPN